MTQRQLAQQSTVSLRAIRNLELGSVRQPRAHTMQLLADSLGLADWQEVLLGDPASTDGQGSPFLSPDGLVGREEEVALVIELLTFGEPGLVTITGLGGVGKSRIATEVVSLLGEAGRPAVLDLDREDLPEGAATIAVRDGVEPSAQAALQIVNAFRDRPNLRMLATARQPLGIPGERTVAVSPLQVPDRLPADLADLTRIASVRLLLMHLRRVQSSFLLTEDNAEVVMELCRQLDGLPAALKTAADWSSRYEPERLLERLRADPFRLLTGDESDHDLLDTLDRSVAVLDEPDRRFLAEVSGLPRGWSATDAARVTGADVETCEHRISQLLLHGLLRRVGGPLSTRYAALNLVARFVAGTGT
jgi:transcriptional regulator with XRE-family HTH domain